MLGLFSMGRWERTPREGRDVTRGSSVGGRGRMEGSKFRLR